MSHSDPKTVLITGASSGLGAATALACAAAGHQVALAARREERLHELARQIGRPADVLVLPTDMRDPESIRVMAARAEERFGRIDALVANAGVGRGEPFAETSEENVLLQMDVNALGVFRCVRTVLPGMLARRSGHILTVSSVAAELPGPGSAIYAASKGAVSAFSEALRREVESSGVQVTTIIPGLIYTEMTSHQPIRMPPASIVGDLVVRLLRRPRRRAVIPQYYGAFIWANRLAPRLVDRVIVRLQADLERRRS